MTIFGIDTSQAANETMNSDALALIGGVPSFWGRYFNGTTTNRKYQYTAAENVVLNNLGIPVLCFARQMWAVNDPSQAEAHALENMKGIIDAFGASYLLDQGGTPIVFLDLEPETKTGPDGHDVPAPERVLDIQYYQLWSAKIIAGFDAPEGTVHFRPAVYLNQKASTQSWINLNAACAAGSVCVGASVAHYVSQNNHDKAAPPLSPDAMVWTDDAVRPAPNPIPGGQADAQIPLLVWQYYENYPKTWQNNELVEGDIDPELVNPAFEALVLSGVIMPPEPTVV